MNYTSPKTNQTTAPGFNFDVKEHVFGANQKGIPVAGKYSGASGTVNAIGEYLIPPSSGTYVLASIGGTIQWLATEECQ